MQGAIAGIAVMLAFVEFPATFGVPTRHGSAILGSPRSRSGRSTIVGDLAEGYRFLSSLPPAKRRSTDAKIG